LKSLKDGRLYVGYSKDLRKRLLKHKRKEVYTTKRMGEIELIFYEVFKKEEDAKRRERYFKTTKGKRVLKIMLKESLL